MPSRCARVREILRTPSTVREIAALLKLNVRTAQLGVWCLTSIKQATHCGKVPNPSDKFNARKTINLYRLTRYGLSMLGRDEEKRKKGR